MCVGGNFSIMLWFDYRGNLSKPGAISHKKIRFLSQICYSDFSLQRTSWIRSSHKEIGIMPLIRCKIWKPAGWGLVHGGPYSNAAFQKWVHFWKKRNALLRCYRGLLVKERFCNDERIFGLGAGGIFIPRPTTLLISTVQLVVKHNLTPSLLH